MVVVVVSEGESAAGEGEEKGRVEPDGLPITVEGVDGWPMLSSVWPFNDSSWPSGNIFRLLRLHLALAF